MTGPFDARQPSGTRCEHRHRTLRAVLQCRGRLNRTLASEYEQGIDRLDELGYLDADGGLVDSDEARALSDALGKAMQDIYRVHFADTGEPVPINVVIAKQTALDDEAFERQLEREAEREDEGDE
ncbi:hypothetical protein [Candidatus Rariloculus sp.]|uniref:hypothetical protein n=1 Tax=Candidatus Rariloculus sp. TaxID=3101265 RepID=UPI003D0F2E9D